MTTADVLLADGAIAVLRSLEPGDAAKLHELHDRVSDDALWLRFFSVARTAAHRYVDHVLAARDTIALVAERDGRIVALATAEPVRDDESEVAFLVDDHHRGLGIATLLLEHLAALARDRGIRRFHADVLSENHRMLEVFADAGFNVRRTLASGVQVLEVDTTVTPSLQAAADAREFAAESRSLAPLLAPRAVAVYGARRDGSGIGAAVLRAIRSGGYTARLVVVHPTAETVDGVAAYPSLGELAEPVDLAVIAVPAEHAVAALEDAGANKVSAAVVISSGFQEMGEGGAVLQHRLSVVARTRGIRLVGPNCLGLVCNDPAVSLNATFSGSVPPSGWLAVASQSGGVGIVLMDLVARAGIGLRYFVSLGNKADVSSNDLLAAWYVDPLVTCGALYLESFGNARKFARFARRFSERKPLLAVVGGRSAGGQRGGASHTAAAASPASGVRALFAQAGVIGCADAEELAETALLLTREQLPAGRRVAVLSNAGGLGVLAADAAEDAGLDVVELSAGLQARIAGLVNQTTGTANPVDAGAGAEPTQIGALADAVLSSGEVDAVVAVLVATGSTDLDATLETLATVREQHPERALLVVPLGGPTRVDHPFVTTFASSAAAVGALGRAAQYADWRRTPPAPTLPSDPAEAMAARLAARELMGADHSGGWVAPAKAAVLLGRYGADLLGLVVPSPEAVDAAEQVGFPVAVKLAEADVVHKTEHRLVRTGLGSAEAVRAAVADFEDNHGVGCQVLVQPMVGGVELALGLVRDRTLGPLVMVAAGGVATDVWADRAFLLPPFAEADALRALRSLRIWPLLDGFRGDEPVATPELTHLVSELGRLALEVPEVAELDINPVIISAQGCHVVDSNLRLAGVDDDLADLPRQLRRVR